MKNRISLKEIDNQQYLVVDGEFKRPQKANQKFPKTIPFSEMKKMDTIELRMSTGDNDLKLEYGVPIIPVLPEGVVKLVFGEMQLLLYFKVQKDNSILLSPHQYDPYGEAPHYFALYDLDYIYYASDINLNGLLNISKDDTMSFLGPFIYAMQQFTKIRMNREIEIRPRTKTALAGEKTTRSKALYAKHHVIDIGQNITIYTDNDDASVAVLERQERVYRISESTRVGHMMHYHKKDGTIGTTWRKPTTVHYKNTTPDAKPNDTKSYRFEKAEHKMWMGEQDIAEFLTEMNIPFIAQADFHTLPFLEKQTLDFYIPDKKLAIEFQGAQHFISIDHFGGEQRFFEQLIRDQKKREKCEKNGIRIVYFATAAVAELDAFRETRVLNYENLMEALRE